MIVYLDTSVVLRILFHEKHPIPVWGKWEKAFSSNLLRTEALRTVDRLRLANKLTDKEVAVLTKDIFTVYETLFILPMSEAILKRAAESFPTTLGTLDALHLATALALQEIESVDFLLTHDGELATAAKSVGFGVLGFD